MRRFLSSLFLYAICASFILGWWTLALREQILSSASLAHRQTVSSKLVLQTSTLFPHLSTLQRDTFQKALLGNYDLIIQLINDWDIDAQILIEKGVQNVQRLSPNQLLQVHLLTRLIKTSSPESRRKINCALRSSSIYDDERNLINLEDNFNHFLPQTYAAASFLLAIAEPEEILAIPKGLRGLTQIYPKTLLDLIPNDLDYHQSEKLFLARPHLTFISPYSSPPIIETFRSQGLALYMIKNLDHLSDIQETLLKLGHATNHPLEASILNFFIEASMLMIDNRLKALNDLYHLQASPKRFLYLYKNLSYTLPTNKSLAGKLLQRLSMCHPGIYCPLAASKKEWRMAFELEKIIQIQPDHLIISSIGTETEIHPILLNYPIIYLDQTIQEFPSQYIALAYFDIFQAIAATYVHTQTL